MKNLLILLFCLLVFSCAENENILDNEIVDLNKINQVVNTINLGEQKILYSMLNKDEMFTLWNNKLNTIVSSRLLNERQTSLIKNFTSNLKSNYFIKNSDEELYFKTVFIPQYLKSLKKEFSINQIGEIFYNIPNKVIIDDGDSTIKKNCDCNRNSMASCVWLNSNTCKEVETCQSTFSGCGFLWAYSCNGKCYPVLN